MNSSFKTGTSSHTSGPDDSGIVFHEKNIEKKTLLNMDAPLKKTTVKNSAVFDVSKVFEDENIETGTIVTDKKRQGDPFSKRLHAVFSEWWGGTKESVQEVVHEVTQNAPQQETTSIPPAETRADIVKEATSFSALAPKDDHHVVLEKIRTFKRDVAKVNGTPVVVKEPIAKESGWSHLVDDAKEEEISVKESLKIISSQPESKKNTITSKAVHDVQPITTHTPTPVSQKATAMDIRPAKPVVTPIIQKTPLPTPVAISTPEQKKETTSIPPAETRADVVKEATSFSALAPKDDHHVVLEKIRTFKRDVAKVNGTPVVVKEPIAKESGWSHLVDDAVGEVIEPVQEVALKNDTPHEETPPPVEKELVPTPEAESQKMEGVWSHTIADNTPQVAIAPKVETRIEKDISEFTAPTQPAEKINIQKIAEEIRMQRKAFTAPAENIVQEPIHSSAVAEQPKEFNSPTSTEDIRVQQKTFAAPAVAVAHEHLPAIPPVEQPVSHTPAEVAVVEAPSTWVSEPVEQPIEEELPPQKVPEPAPIIVRDSITEPAFHSMATVQIPEEQPIEEEVAPLVPTPTHKEPSVLFHIILRYGMFFGVTLCGIGLALVVSVHFNLFSTPSNTPAEPTPIVATEQKPTLTLTGTREEFLTTLQTLITQSGDGFTTFEPTIGIGASARPATAQEILTFIGVHLDEKTMRNLNNSMTLGSITTTKNEPFVILTSSNFDLLFTGLLGWERHIDTDLAPLFGAPQSNDIYFTDAVRGNASTRILYDTSHSEVMLYSFINQHTVVITTSSEALSKIIERF